MMGRNNTTIAMALGLALGLAATPALARSSMRAGYDARAEVPAGDIGGISAHRAQALRQCNERSAKKVEYTWGDTQSDEIRACMAQHGEGE